jgi:cytochrome c oxidase subunit 4
MEETVSYRMYWTIWVVLLVLTLIMIGVEALSLPSGIAILILVGAMMTKATLIAGWFMHLKFETRFIMLVLVLGTLVTAAFLLFLLVPDAIDANRMAEYPLGQAPPGQAPLGQNPQ